MEIFPVVSALNEFPYIQTIECCSGRGAWEAFVNGASEHDAHQHRYSPFVWMQVSDMRGLGLCAYVVNEIGRWQDSKRYVDTSRPPTDHGPRYIYPQEYCLRAFADVSHRGEVTLFGREMKPLSKIVDDVRAGRREPAAAAELVRGATMEFWEKVYGALRIYQEDPAAAYATIFSH